MSSGFQLAQHQATAYESFTAVFMDGSARLLAEGVGIGAGDVVLDLACGTGLVARHVAPLVVPGGRVVGADINPAMLDVARTRIDSGIASGIEWVLAPCDDLPCDDHTFTHAICQQGFQFFPDASAAMVETLRVLQPGGTVVATVWATPGQNPYIDNQLELLAAHDPSLAASVGRATPPDADDLLRTTAQVAGFSDISVTLLEHDVDIDDLGSWFLAQTAGTPWGPTLGALTPPARHDLVAEMVTRLQPWATPGGRHRIPFRSHRLTATAPR